MRGDTDDIVLQDNEHGRIVLSGTPTMLNIPVGVQEDEPEQHDDDSILDDQDVDGYVESEDNDASEDD
jgi:hypothetical protein